jgi:hypothetical protein
VITHSHVIAGVTNAENPQALSAVDKNEWRILSYSDTASLGGAQSFSITLPGRAALTSDGHRRPWREILSTGDLIQAGGWNWNGEGERPKPRTTADGLIVRIDDSEAMTAQGYSYTTTLSCQGLGSVLQNDSVAWWMYYGSAEGWVAARGKLLADDLSGTIDKMLGNYMNKVVFHSASWNRAGQGLGARLGYHLTALSPSAPIQTNLAIAEGTHWSIMQEFVDAPLHEMFTRVMPGDYLPQGGFQHTPTLKAESALIGQLAGDNGRTWLFFRPAPFPYASDTGKTVFSSWRALELHDFTETESVSAPALGTGIDGVRNFFMVYPAVQFLDETMAFTVGIAIENRTSINRLSYRPLKTRTHLALGKGKYENFITLAKALTWRLAGQWNRNDEYYDASLEVPFAPEVQPGHRVRFRGPLGDETKQGQYEGYVTSRTHTWTPENGGRTSVQLSRVLLVSNYADPAWFVKNLAPVQVRADETAPSSQPVKK